MKSWFIHIGTFVMLAAVAGVVVMVSGAVPIKASSGHWPITKWVLEFSMSRSVSTHSMGIQAPPNLGDEAMVMKGAGHYESGCAPCHGSPNWTKPRVAQRLTPVPPALPAKITNWKPEELFYIVKHGVLFTGMPAFPSQKRDDEVWGVVAFLLQFPQLDRARYRELVDGTEAVPKADVPLAVLKSCAGCHGIAGQGRETSAFPRLGGLHVEYFVAAMQAYSTGKRHSGIMEPISGRLSDDEIREIADFYTRRRDAARTPAEGDDLASAANEDKLAAIRRGETIAQSGLPEQEVGACIACHSAIRDEHNPNYPVLNGQFADYLVLQLSLFKQRHRGGSEYAELMHPIADGLKLEQMQNVAAYYASLEGNTDSIAEEADDK
ncbi:MAG: c-type cytochrome [Pirellulaceae bacterium]